MRPLRFGHVLTSCVRKSVQIFQDQPGEVLCTFQLLRPVPIVKPHSNNAPRAAPPFPTAAHLRTLPTNCRRPSIVSLSCATAFPPPSPEKLKPGEASQPGHRLSPYFPGHRDRNQDRILRTSAWSLRCLCEGSRCDWRKPHNGVCQLIGADR